MTNTLFEEAKEHVTKKLIAPWADEHDEPTAEEGAIEAGRRSVPFTFVHDWVTLSDVPPEAKCLYNMLRMHVFDKANTMTCGPRQDDLALMMGYAHGHQLSKFFKALQKLGAVDIVAWGLPRRNKYIVHETPPKGYAGPVTIKEWRALHHDTLTQRREATQKANAAKKENMRKRAATK